MIDRRCCHPLMYWRHINKGVKLTPGTQHTINLFIYVHFINRITDCVPDSIYHQTRIVPFVKDPFPLKLNPELLTYLIIVYLLYFSSLLRF